MVSKEYFTIYIDGVEKTYKALQKLEEVFPYVWEGSDVASSFNNSDQTTYFLMGGDPLRNEKYDEFKFDFHDMLVLNEISEKGIRTWEDFYEYWAKILKGSVTHES